MNSLEARYEMEKLIREIAAESVTGYNETDFVWLAHYWQMEAIALLAKIGA